MTSPSQYPAAIGGPALVRAAALALPVAENRAWIDPQIARGLGAIASVQLEHVVDVLALPLLARVRERQDLRGLLARQPQVLGAQEGLVGQHDGFLEPILELADVALPL